MNDFSSTVFALIAVAVVCWVLSCAPTIDYIRDGDPCRSDSCAVVK